MKLSLCCPECARVWLIHIECFHCGWKLPEMKPQHPLRDWRCEYTLADRRCPLPGTICRHPYGKGPWYCAGHSSCFDDLRLSEAVLRHAEENYEAIMAARRDWREVALDKYFESVKKQEIKPTTDTSINPSQSLNIGDQESEN